MSLGEEYIRVQTCVLRVSIHCNACRKNVANRLRRIDGVYIVTMDPGQGVVTVKVTMAPEMSPDVLINKIRSRGKRTFVELLLPPSGPPAALVVPLPTPTRPSPARQPQSVTPSPVRQPVAVVAEDDDDDDDEEEEEEECEEEEEEEEEENVVPPRANGTRSTGGSRVLSRMPSPPQVNASGSTAALPRSVPSGGVNPFQLGGGQMPNAANMAEAIRAMAAARGVPVGGGLYMGQQVGPTESPYNLPPRPTYGGPTDNFHGANVMIHPNPYEQQQLAATVNNYPQHSMNQYHQYAAPAPTQKEVIDGFTYQFNDENTGSCNVM